jgi:hypothetical protein
MALAHRYFPVLMKPGPKATIQLHIDHALGTCKALRTLPLCAGVTMCVVKGATLARCQRSFCRLTFQLLNSEPQRVNSKALRDCKRQTCEVRSR